MFTCKLLIALSTTKLYTFMNRFNMSVEITSLIKIFSTMMASKLIGTFMNGRTKLSPSKVVCLALETLKLNWIKLNIFLKCHCNIRKVSWYKLVTSSPSSRIASTTIFKDWQEQNNEHWNWKKRKSFNVIIVAICFPTFSILAAHSSNLIIEIEN